MSISDYKVTIGIETHVQLNTKTKLFAGIDNDARDSKPNTLISHICLGMPGALPVLNKRTVELSILAGFALNTNVNKLSKFDRKHYFYPDLPKGYQITQFDQPIIEGGYVDIDASGQKKRIAITRAHLEEDAGKSSHPEGVNYSLVDLNRAGTPLLEIVSEPEINSAAEAKAYAKELNLLMRYSGVSEGNLFYGNMRFDVNISLSKDPKKLGVRSETKNLNSYRSVEKAVEFEIKRQAELLDKGQRVVQETRGFDDAKQKTFSQRNKEDSDGYWYFPEPDIPPVIITDEMIKAQKDNMPISPVTVRASLLEVGLSKDTVEMLVEQIPAGRFLYQLYKSSDDKSAVKRIGNWLSTDVQSLVATGDLDWSDAQLNNKHWLQLASMVKDNKVSSTGAKQIALTLAKNGGLPEEIAKSNNLLQVSDESAIVDMVKTVIEENPQASEDIKNGEIKAIGFLVGQIMKQSKGKANPGVVQKLIKEQLQVS